MDSEKERQLREKFDETIDFFQEELKGIRTGRANPQIVEDLEIEYYGAKSPLKQTASVTAQDARTIVITPWDKDNLVDIEKAINEADLGINPANDGNAIRITFPPMTEERRTELTKMVGQKTEEARVKIRQGREEIWDEIQKGEQAGEISEDEKFQSKDDLQKIVDEYNRKVEELSKKKEKEVATV